MIRPRMSKVTSRLPKKLPPNSLITLGKTGEVTQVTEVTGKYSPIGREGCSLIGVYFPGFGLPGYLSLSSSSYLIEKKEREERRGQVTVTVTLGNLTEKVVTECEMAA